LRDKSGIDCHPALKLFCRAFAIGGILNIVHMSPCLDPCLAIPNLAVPSLAVPHLTVPNHALPNPAPPHRAKLCLAQKSFFLQYYLIFKKAILPGNEFT